ncbi:MAG: flagellar hook-basal body protein [Planctomycetota bacterium]
MTRYAEIALVRGLGYLAEAQGAITHNLANVDTAGFKRRAPVAVESGRAFDTVLGERMPMVRYGEVADWSQGTARETGNRLDVALGQGTWLRVQDGQGRTYLTRDGSMQIDAQGRLVTRDGMRYLDQGGNTITLDGEGGAPADVAIAPNGQLSDPRTGQTWGPLGVFEVADPRALMPQGGGLYTVPDDVALKLQPEGVQQGFQEGSNVDSLQELVQMIIVQRSFSATQKALTGIGRMQDQLIQNINR